MSPSLSMVVDKTVDSSSVLAVVPRGRPAWPRNSDPCSLVKLFTESPAESTVGIELMSVLSPTSRNLSALSLSESGLKLRRATLDWNSILAESTESPSAFLPNSPPPPLPADFESVRKGDWSSMADVGRLFCVQDLSPCPPAAPSSLSLPSSSTLYREHVLAVDTEGEYSSESTPALAAATSLLCTMPYPRAGSLAGSVVRRNSAEFIDASMGASSKESPSPSPPS
mmetsp:Transcript_27691/g.61318  ORF Transcript_27691/g.61318 Transcript_27691/m.61318 type:complete len:226 (+) Transcript_27691:260-937(+)